MNFTFIFNLWNLYFCNVVFLLPWSKLFSVNDFLDSHQFRVALRKHDNLPGSAGPRCSGRIGQLISATSRLRQKVSGGDGHAQVRVLVDGSVAAFDRDVVVSFVPEEEVVGDRHGEHGPAPGERARTSYECNLEVEIEVVNYNAIWNWK